MHLLQVSHLTKKYPGVVALNDVSFQVEAGEVLGILGPNGSGKTTMLGILLGVVNATAGSYSWFGNGAKKSNRLRIGALLQTPIFYPDVSARQNLNFAATLKGLPTTSVLPALEEVGLSARADDLVQTFSLGMKQRLGIAIAMLGYPDVLIFDEPTNGLDPEAIATVRNLMVAAAASGRTIILASHILDEVEKICSHVVVLDHGRILDSGSLAKVVGAAKLLEISALQVGPLRSHLEKMTGVAIEHFESDIFTISFDSRWDVASINRALVEAGVQVNRLYLVGNSLEKKFLELLREG